MKPIFKKALSVLLVFLFAVGIIPVCKPLQANAISLTTSEVTEKLNSIKSIYSGKYWNGNKTEAQLISAVDNGKTDNSSLGLTTTGCPGSYQSSGCTSNTFGGGRQCFGFAFYMDYVLFRARPNKNGGAGYTVYTGNNCLALQPGDHLISPNESHSAIVWKIEGGKIYVVDVWGSKNDNHAGCLINYGWFYYNGSSYTTPDSLLNLIKSGGKVLRPTSYISTTPAPADTTPPTISNLSVTNISGTSFTINCNLSDNVGISYVWLNIYGPNGTQAGFREGASAGSYSYTVQTADYGGPGLYAVHLYAYDAAGNGTSTVFNDIIAVNDTTPPTISNLSVTNITGTSFTINCNLSDNIGISYVWLNIYGPNGTQAGFSEGASAGSYSYTVQTADYGGPGLYAVHLYAYDAAGNGTSTVFNDIIAVNYYNIIYNHNDGTSTTFSQTKKFGEALTLSTETPTRDSYTFTGWNTKVDGVGTSYAPGDSYTANEDVTLYAQWVANTPVIATFSGAVIDNQTHQITGLTADCTAAVFEQNYVTVSGGSFEYEFPTAKQVMGTGTTVKVYDVDHQLIDTYTIVIFGDVNGDGWYDGTDAYFVKLAASGMIPQTALTEAQLLAADANHDGNIDNADVALLEQAGLLLANVDQTLPSEELQTDSVYLEYCSLIDQTVEIIEPEQPAAEQPAQTAEQPAAPSVWGWIKALFTIVLNWLLRVF